MRNRLTAWAFALILLAIPVLGYIQWRWIDRVTQAEIERETERVHAAIRRVASEFNAEVTRAHLFFTPEPLVPAVESLARQMAEWNARAPVPDIVKEVVLAGRPDSEAVRIPRWGAVQTEPVLPAPPPYGRPPLAIVGGVPALLMPAGDLPRRPFRFGPPPPLATPPPGPAAVRMVLLQPQALLGFLQTLVDRHLDPGRYRVTIQGDQGSPPGQFAPPPDAAEPVLAVRPDCLIPPGQRGGGPRGGPGPPWMRNRADWLAMPPQPCPVSPDDGLWRVEVRHSTGSLAGAIRQVRNQNLTLSFGVLALLTAAVAGLWVSVRRARSLAQRQIEFAMSVSHELRTPLTVMRLAGDNLASGMGGNPDQVKRYGETIRSQAERLGHMVEQVLTFARSERPDWHVHTAAVHPDTILNAAAASAEPVLREAGCDLQVEVEDRLRPVESDANLMTAAVSNLLVNAARYGAAGRWVRARTYADGDTVVFEVSDRGAGMAARDLRRAFEPFYRGRNAGKTRGAGLGLHLVRRIAEAHGGRVDIESTLGAGTQVRIHLPAATVREEGSGEAASADRRG